ncbi:MAG: hydroxymethylglutaryl-CoA lyase [Blastomonas sp.]
MRRYPERVHIQEVGPRDGLQLESRILSLSERAELIAAIRAAGVQEMEVGSFVSPRAVPQMAGTADLLARLPDPHPAHYRALWLNQQGLQAALAAPNLSVAGYLQLSASDGFSLRNIRKTVAQSMEEHDGWIKGYRDHGIATETLIVMAAFGCNYDGVIAPERVEALIEATIDRLARCGEHLRRVVLADTMGWASPGQVRAMVRSIRTRWPDMIVRLHLHDTRGLAIANALSALEEGVSEFDAAIGGMGGCPFSGSAGAVGNMCTEDFVFLCHQLGIETGIDLAKLVDVARLAERLVGHDLPGRVMKAGTPLDRHAQLAEAAAENQLVEEAVR